MSGAPAFWSERSPRERLMLGALGALVLVLGYGFLALRPLHAAAAAAQTRLDRAVGDLIAVRSLAPGSGAPPAGPTDPAALRAVVSETAAQAGLAVARIAPEGERALTLTLDSVGAQALFGWLRTLEAERGVRIERVALQPAAEERVEAQITVAAP